MHVQVFIYLWEELNDILQTFTHYNVHVLRVSLRGVLTLSQIVPTVFKPNEIHNFVQVCFILSPVIIIAGMRVRDCSSRRFVHISP